MIPGQGGQQVKAGAEAGGGASLDREQGLRAGWWPPWHQVLGPSWPVSPGALAPRSTPARRVEGLPVGSAAAAGEGSWQEGSL